MEIGFINAAGEEQEKKDGYVGRIQGYRELKQTNELINKVYNGNLSEINDFGDFKKIMKEYRKNSKSDCIIC